MDKEIKKHFGKVAKTGPEKKQLRKLLADDKVLDKEIAQDKRRGKKV